MRTLLRAKLRQCKQFRDKIREVKAAGNRIVHSTYPSDRFWASGFGHEVKQLPSTLLGKNKHGLLLMELYDDIKR